MKRTAILAAAMLLSMLTLLTHKRPMRMSLYYGLPTLPWGMLQI
jgi:hypothetical protein